MKDKPLSLAERWAMDEKMGATAIVYRCHMCKHRGEGLSCAIYGTIPEVIARAKETCFKHEPGELDMSKITF